MQTVRPKRACFCWQPKDSALYLWRCALFTLFSLGVFPILRNGKVSRTCTPIVTQLGPLCAVVNDSMSRFTVFLLIKGYESTAHV